MSKRLIFLDESGDLGWKFGLPYRSGGSSRHLTIASVSVDPDLKHLPKRILKKLARKFGWPRGSEKKWSCMRQVERLAFAEAAAQLVKSHPHGVSYHSIVVKKQRVMAHIRNDPNLLYNYMIKLSLLDEMSSYGEVLFVPDPRAIKVKSGNSMHDYLQAQLYFESGVTTLLTTNPQDSAVCGNIQFADMLSGAVQHHFEDGNGVAWRVLRSCVDCKTLYFNE